MNSASLAIRRLRIEALLPADRPECEAVRRRLADAAKHGFAPALGRALSQWDEERVVLIRRLHVESSLDLALSDEALAEVLAARVAEEIRRLAEDPDDSVAVFPDRAAHLAAFLIALAEDGSRDRWWFRTFDGVKVLPKPAAIRTVLLADPAEGVRALTVLPEPKRQRVIAALGDAEAVRVGEGLTAAADGTPEMGAVIAAIAAAGRGGPAEAGLPPMCQALDLYLRVAAATPALAGRRLLGAATALVRLRAAVGELDTARAAALLRAVRGGYAPAPLPGAEALRRAIAVLLPLPPAERRTAVAFALAARRPEAAAGPEAGAAVAFTRFGGLFLLLPSHFELPVTAEAAAWPQPPASRAEDLLSLLVLAACAGRGRAAVVLADPLWRDLLRLPPMLDAEAVDGWLAALPRRARRELAASAVGEVSRRDALHLALPPAWCRSRRMRRRIAGLAHTALRGFARRLPGFAASSAAFLWRNFLQTGARVEFEPDAIRVFVARPPLDVVLSLTGAGRAAFSLSDGRNVSIERLE
jgi:hypothetical protein